MKKLKTGDMVNLCMAAAEMAEVWPFTPGIMDGIEYCRFCSRPDNGMNQHNQDCAYAIVRSVLELDVTLVERNPPELPA